MSLKRKEKQEYLLGLNHLYSAAAITAIV
jgi:hypothetical protein